MPSTMSPERVAKRARLGGMARSGVKPDDPRRIEVLQDITADRLGDQIRAALDVTPLRPEQIRQLKALLGGAR